MFEIKWKNEVVKELRARGWSQRGIFYAMKYLRPSEDESAEDYSNRVDAEAPQGLASNDRDQVLRAANSMSAPK